MTLLLSIWREFGRHLELPSALQGLFPALQESLGISAILVRRVDVPGARLETVASAPAVTESAISKAPAEPAVDVIVALAGWCSQGGVVQGRNKLRRLGLGPLLPEGHPTADVLMAGLAASNATGERTDAHPAALVLISEEGQTFSREHAALVRELIEPFTVGVDNHYRLRELRTLREAAEAENRALLARLDRQAVSDTIVGDQAGLASVMDRVQLVANSDAPVLILGETGTGKEVVARAIHARSRRSQGPMIRVNCGAIPPELVDSELFGHDRGSFTGATATRKGWFERADGGTLFLDEIGDLPAAAQVRLLRVLQDGTFERVGGQTALAVDVRVVAATHRDLHEMVRQRTFREDLWYRISVFPIHLPPLRDRVEDIAPLATHFSLKAAKRLGLPPALPSPEDLRMLTAYNWPGNVRELASVIERAAILGGGVKLDVTKALGVGPTGASPTATMPAGMLPTEAHAKPLTLEAAEIQHIESALRASLGRVEGPFGAAKALDINPHTLRSRMRKLGIKGNSFRILKHPANNTGTMR